jgi:hypothetical protein
MFLSSWRRLARHLNGKTPALNRGQRPRPSLKFRRQLSIEELDARVLPSVTVSPTSLPNWGVNAAYNQAMSASGGVAPYAFTVTSGALPAGLTLGNNGLLSGTPTAGGTYNFTVTATDSSLGSGGMYTTLDDPAASPGQTFATGISGSNIVGYYYDSSGTLGFLNSGSAYTELQVPYPQANPGATYAQGVSGSNVVGYYYKSSVGSTGMVSTKIHGFLYNGSSYTTLDHPSADFTQAEGISGRNVVGY